MTSLVLLIISLSEDVDNAVKCAMLKCYHTLEKICQLKNGKVKEILRNLFFRHHSSLSVVSFRGNPRNTELLKSTKLQVFGGEYGHMGHNTVHQLSEPCSSKKCLCQSQ